jgi:hypothetical protein
MLCYKPAPIVHGAAGRVANNQPDGFAFEKFIRGRMTGAGDQGKERQETDELFHKAS